jgi:hypothetical protein
MARTKFTFEKRQKEIAKRQKKEEKAARRAEAKQLKAAPESVVRTEDHEMEDVSADSPPATENPVHADDHEEGSR